jgi:hypothetical protein
MGGGLGDCTNILCWLVLIRYHDIHAGKRLIHEYEWEVDFICDCKIKHGLPDRSFSPPDGSIFAYQVVRAGVPHLHRSFDQFLVGIWY